MIQQSSSIEYEPSSESLHISAKQLFLNSERNDPRHVGIAQNVHCAGSGSRVQGSGSKGPGFRVQGSGFRVQGPGSRVQGPGSRVQSSGFRVQSAGFRVEG